MSHFLLPARGADAPNQADGRYGDEVLALMLQELALVNVKPAECQAKIFGGGDMFSSRRGSRAPTVGRKNGETARALLQNHMIPIVSESLFGVGHRQVIFDIENGHVWSRQIPPVDVS